MPSVPWTPIDGRMPPEGVVVQTDGSEGKGVPLKWKDRHWQSADGTQYRGHQLWSWRPLAPPASNRTGPAAPVARGVGAELVSLFLWGVGAAALTVAAVGFTTPELPIRTGFLAVLLVVVGVSLLFGLGRGGRPERRGQRSSR